MTFAVLRALHTVIGDALDDIERVYADPTNFDATSSPSSPTTEPSSPIGLTRKASNGYASPPPSPSVSSFRPITPTSPSSSTSSSLPDFPSLDTPYDPASLSEALTSHPAVMSAINRIVAAAGQMSSTVQRPFMSLCDASMGYHLPSCLRLLEASHTVEVLREAGPSGLHVRAIAAKTGVDQSKLAHILRLLASHHILREVSPNVFANNRLSSLIDSGKPFEVVKNNPEIKYEDTDGIAAFIGMCTDELFKSSAYLTEAYLLSSQSHKNGREPTRAPFNYAFGCEGIGFFGWLEGEGIEGNHVNGAGREDGLQPGLPPATKGPGVAAHRRVGSSSMKKEVDAESLSRSVTPALQKSIPPNPNRFRLERFGKAMTGTESWEVPGAILGGFPWHSLPKGSTLVDVGGGIGSTSMLLAHAFSSLDGPNEEDNLGLKFIIQDRDVVCDLGERAWKAQCPHLLESGIARFQKHDFFTPQPIKHAAVYLLRVVLHDWPNAYAQRILLRLREAASEDTKLLIADFVLPLACADDFSNTDLDGSGLEDVQGAEKMLAPAPLLPNLGKASSSVYWMDLTMQVTFNGQERTLREIVALARSTGWKVTKVTKAPGSLFGHIIAVPAEIPLERRARAGSGSALLDVPAIGSAIPRYTGGAGSEGDDDDHLDPREIKRASSRCGTPTFGSRMNLPSYEEARARFGGGGLRRKPSALKPPASTIPKKKKPSPLSIIPSSPSPTPMTPRSSVLASPRQPPPGPTLAAGSTESRSMLKRQMSHAQLSSLYSRSGSQTSTGTASGAASPTPSSRQTNTPVTPRSRASSLSRRSSLANLRTHQPSRSQTDIPVPPLPPAFKAAQKEKEKESSEARVKSPSPTSTAGGLRSPASPYSPSTGTRLPTLSRHPSQAHLSPTTTSRKRSESIIANALPASLGGRANTLLRTLELSGQSQLSSSPGASTTAADINTLASPARARAPKLEFGEELPQTPQRSDAATAAASAREKRLPGDSLLGLGLGLGRGSDFLEERERERERDCLPPPGSVLAAAARIEKSLPKTANSDYSPPRQ